jgi:hypothetical protein
MRPGRVFSASEFWSLTKHSTQIFLLGAEFTWVFAHGNGSRVNQPAA